MNAVKGSNEKEKKEKKKQSTYCIFRPLLMLNRRRNVKFIQ